MAKKLKFKKSRMSAILDNAVMSNTVREKSQELSDATTTGIDLRHTISTKSAKAIRKMLAHCPLARVDYGNLKSGNCAVNIIVTDNDETYSAARYEFVDANTGGHSFLNVRANPTRLIAGKNSLPVLVSGLRELNQDNKGKHTALLTFQLSNRLPFILLEHLPSTYPFKWEGKDRDTYVDGDIRINDYQIAWYSAMLSGVLNVRDLEMTFSEVVFNFFRACYGGNGSLSGKVKNLSSYLGLEVKQWDNSDNITIKATSGKNKKLQLTLYSKVQEIESKTGATPVEADRIRNLIRFDCSFANEFWRSQNIHTISDLEDKYEELCEAGRYDASFIHWISKELRDVIKLDYVSSMTSEKYFNILKTVELEEKENQRKLLDHWLNGGDFENIKEVCANTGVDYSHFSRYQKDILHKHGLDIRVPRSYHVEMLFNRVSGLMTEEEKAEYLKPQGSNRLKRFEELVAIDTEHADKISEILGTGLNAIRGMAVKSRQYKKLWIFDKIKNYA